MGWVDFPTMSGGNGGTGLLRATLWTIFFRTLAVSVVLVAPGAHACSCLPPPEPCQAFWEASAVFTGKVTKIVTKGDSTRTAEFDVKESFRGDVGTRVRVSTDSSGAACGYNFTVGTTYVVYASGPSNAKLSTFLCSRTQPLSSDSPDLEYAKNHSTRKKAIAYGHVFLRDATGFHRLSGARVALSPNPGAAATTTDEYGRFQIEVNPGAYALQASSSGLRMLPDAFGPIRLPEGSACSERNVFLVVDGKIRGRVTSPSGSAVSGVLVEALASSLNFLDWTAVTNSNGFYELNGLGPGAYRVGTSIERGPSAFNPFPTTYFPGVATADSARILTIAARETREHVDFAVREKLTYVLLSGTVTWPDGSPARAHLLLDPDGSAHTDSRGGFSLSVRPGSRVISVDAQRGSREYSARAVVDVNGPVSGLRIRLEEARSARALPRRAEGAARSAAGDRPAATPRHGGASRR